MCVPVPDVNTPGGTQGESSKSSADVEEPSAPGEESPKIADVEVEEPSTPRDDSPAPTGPKINTDEPSVAGTNSRAALEAMQDKEESAKPSGKPGSSNADRMVDTPLGRGSSNMALGSNARSALTLDLTSKKPATITEPLPAVTEATPQEFMGTVVDTAHGVAVQVGGERIPVDDSVASRLAPGEHVEISEEALPAGQGSSVPDRVLGEQRGTDIQDSTTTPQDVVPGLLVGVIAALLPALRRRESRASVGTRSYSLGRTSAYASSPLNVVRAVATPASMSVGDDTRYIKADNKMVTKPLWIAPYVPGEPAPEPLFNVGKWVLMEPAPGGLLLSEKYWQYWVPADFMEAFDEASRPPGMLPPPKPEPEITLADLPTFTPSPPEWTGDTPTDNKSVNLVDLLASVGYGTNPLLAVAVASSDDAVGQVIADQMRTRYGDMSADRFLHYLYGNGEPLPFTAAETDAIISASDTGASDTISPQQYQANYTNNMLNSDEVRGDAYKATTTQEPVVGYYSEGWNGKPYISSSNPDHYNTLGSFSMSGSTRYVVYPPDEYGNQRIEYETVYFIYDVYDFEFGTDYGTEPIEIAAQGAINTAEILHRLGAGHEYVAVGTSSTTPIEETTVNFS